MDHIEYEHHDFLQGYDNRPSCVDCGHVGHIHDNQTCSHQKFAKILVIGDSKGTLPLHKRLMIGISGENLSLLANGQG